MTDFEPFSPSDSVLNFRSATNCKPRETPFSATFAKQRELDRQLVVMPLEKMIPSIERETGVSFMKLFHSEYDVLRPDGTKEPVRTSLSDRKDRDIDDLRDYFTDQPGRRYYRYIDRSFRPEIPENERKDFLIVEEEMPSGVIVAIFDYPTDLFTKEVTVSGRRQKVSFLNLRDCYAVKMDGDDRSSAQAIDLTGFWQKELPVWSPWKKTLALIRRNPFLRGQRDEMTVQRIGFIPQNIPMTLQDQVNTIKEDGYLLVQDSNSPTRWLDRLLPVAAFSQSEKDKDPGSTYLRGADVLGMIRDTLGEKMQSEQDMLQKVVRTFQKILFRRIHQSVPADGKEALRKNAWLATEEWLRNRLAVALYIPLRLHRLGFDLIPPDTYRQYAVAANNMVTNLLRHPFDE